jgi:hypothetical protein
MEAPDALFAPFDNGLLLAAFGKGSRADDDPLIVSGAAFALRTALEEATPCLLEEYFGLAA